MMRRLVFGFVGAALLLAACGGGSDDDGERIDLERSATTESSADSDDGPEVPDGDIEVPEDGEPQSPDDGGPDISAPEVSGEGEDAYVEALTLNFELDPENATFASEAGCIAPEWVAELGVDRFEEAGVSPQDLAEQSSMREIMAMEPSLETSHEMLQAVKDCDVDLMGAILDSPALEEAPEPVRECLSDGLTEDMVLDSMTAALASEAEPDEAEKLIEPFEKLMDECMDPSENDP